MLRLFPLLTVSFSLCSLATDAQAAWFALMAGRLVDLSYQQVLDCSIGYGCAGDWPEIAFTFAIVNGECRVLIETCIVQCALFVHEHESRCERVVQNASAWSCPCFFRSACCV